MRRRTRHRQRLAGFLAMLTLAIALAAPAAAQDDRAEPRRRPGDETLTLLEQTVIPPRDRIDLARRLMGVTGIPGPPATPPAEPELGAVRTFWVTNLDDDYEFQVDAELIYKTEHIYVYYEVGRAADWDAIKRSTDAFEAVIRPRVHEVFGREWLPGIDGDPHMVILHAHHMGDWVAAYYGSSSEYPVEAVSTSNEAEMFYVNLDTMRGVIGTAEYESVLAHEFQHMIHWHVDQNEESWLDEGASELAAMIAGYGASSAAWVFLRDPALQLNTWEEHNRSAHYGASFMFLAYFFDRYGEAGTTALVRHPENGLAGIEATLAEIGATDPASGAPVTLVDLFADWLVANLLRSPDVGDGRYTYHFPAMRDLPPANMTHELSASGEPVALEVPQWGAHTLYVPGGAQPRTYRLSFEGSETVSIVPVEAHSGRYMAWSNRADESNTRFTRAFDLTGVRRATLHFWTWYHIEVGWDYAYVTVSTDGGARWTPLVGPRMTTDDPHSNAYGPGYTGQSGGWVEETIDLSPYAGQEILLRFEYITDDAMTQPGFVVDDIRIPEIGYREDFERGDGGWQGEGWLRMDNRLPQTFLVQVVQPGVVDRPVTRLIGPDDASQGEWTLTVGGQAGDAAILVAGLAPVTTEPARYRLTLTRE
ncbi:MAG TPA: immune inhibitor A [Aggregatilineaceae bacterium]|nr:immune inhibitor A [Aggregatilineaceae bacterium]